MLPPAARGVDPVLDRLLGSSGPGPVPLRAALGCPARGSGGPIEPEPAHPTSRRPPRGREGAPRFGRAALPSPGDQPELRRQFPGQGGRSEDRRPAGGARDQCGALPPHGRRRLSPGDPAPGPGEARRVRSRGPGPARLLPGGPGREGHPRGSEPARVPALLRGGRPSGKHRIPRLEDEPRGGLLPPRGPCSAAGLCPPAARSSQRLYEAHPGRRARGGDRGDQQRERPDPRLARRRSRSHGRRSPRSPGRAMERLAEGEIRRHGDPEEGLEHARRASREGDDPGGTVGTSSATAARRRRSNARGVPGFWR